MSTKSVYRPRHAQKARLGRIRQPARGTTGGQRPRGQAPRLVGGLVASSPTRFGMTLYRVSGVHGSATPTLGLVDWQPVAGNSCGCPPLPTSTELNEFNLWTLKRVSASSPTSRVGGSALTADENGRAADGLQGSVLDRQSGTVGVFPPLYVRAHGSNRSPRSVWAGRTGLSNNKRAHYHAVLESRHGLVGRDKIISGSETRTICCLLLGHGPQSGHGSREVPQD